MAHKKQSGRKWFMLFIVLALAVGLNGAALSTGTTPNYGPYNDGASSSAWRWSRVATYSGLNAGDNYTANFWAAGPGFSLDKIVITDNPEAVVEAYRSKLHLF